MLRSCYVIYDIIYVVSQVAPPKKMDAADDLVRPPPSPKNASAGDSPERLLDGGPPLVQSRFQRRLLLEETILANVVLKPIPDAP